MTYLLVFMMNVINLKPVIVKDCIPTKKEVVRDEAALATKQLAQGGFVCEKNSDLVSYNCQNAKTNAVAKVVAVHDKFECKGFPKKMATDLKTLMDRK